jgi:thiol:disulfide interchange protein
LDQALSKAKTSKKLVMVDFYADWCGPCHTLDEVTWQDSKVQSWLREKTIAVKIDVDKDGELAAKYGASSIPLIVFLKPDGSEVGRLVGYHPPEEFLQKANELLAAKKVAGN